MNSGKFQYFLNCLASVGGNLLILSLFVLGLLLYTLFARSPNATVVGQFTTFAGALLLALKGRTSDTNPPPGSTASSSSSTTTSTSGSGIPGEGHP